MQEIFATTVNIKINDDHRDKFYLVHNGVKVVGFGRPGSRAAIPENLTMLVGTEAELNAEIEKLELEPLEQS